VKSLDQSFEEKLVILTAFGAEYQTVYKWIQNPSHVHTKKDHGFASVSGHIGPLSVHLLVTGMGGESCEKALSQLNLKVGSKILLTGFGGSLSERVVTGDLFLALSEVQFEKEWPSSIPLKRGRILCVEEPVLKRELKLDLAQKFQAEVVDMESDTVLKWCAQHGHPLQILKAIMDDLSTTEYSRDGLKQGVRMASKTLDQVFGNPHVLRLFTSAT
jgi:nucleoside phosphorylase